MSTSSSCRGCTERVREREMRGRQRGDRRETMRAMLRDSGKAHQ